MMLRSILAKELWVRLSAFVAWFPLALIGAFVALSLPRLPAGLGNALFFFPQFAFPYNTFTAAPPNPGPRVWPGFWIMYWALVGIAFAVSTRQRRVWSAFLIAAPTIFLATLVLRALIGALGLYHELDGP
jgi:hypothetical protein